MTARAAVAEAVGPHPHSSPQTSMSEAAPKDAPASPKAPFSKWLRRIVTAQESGLALVIVALMAGLAIYGGLPQNQKEKPLVQDLSFEATTEVVDGGALQVDDAGERTVFEPSFRPRVGTRPDSAKVRTGDRVTVIGPATVVSGGDTVEVPAGERLVLEPSGGETAFEIDGAVELDARGRVSFFPAAAESEINLRADGSGELEYRQPAVFYRKSANRFFELNNLMLVVTNASFIAVMSVGMTAVIVLAGIDLSIGSVYALSAIVGALVLNSLPVDTSVWGAVFLGLLVCCGVGGACGLANGAMSVGLRVHPFVITLGTMAALRGLTIILPQELRGSSSISFFPNSFLEFFKFELPGFAGIFPVPALIMLGVTIAGVFVLNRTVFGRRVYAIGGNETAAGYAGIPVGRVKIIVYTITGILAGLSACMYLGYYGAAETSAGNGYELRVIAAAVIGGASLMGGRGSALGAMLGAVLVELITNGMIILEIDNSYNQIVMGAAIVIAVVIDQTKARFVSRG